MPSSTLALAIASGVLCAAFVVHHAAPPAVPEPVGHLILQIEGDAAALQVVGITPKPDPYGRDRARTDHAIVVLGPGGRELGRFPLDLSAFDLEPARIGAPLRVEGCRVIDSRVVTLASVPRFPTATGLSLVDGDRVLGSVDTPTYARLVAAGERR